MSYDLFTFHCPPGRDASDVADELLEVAEESTPAPTEEGVQSSVAQVVEALRAEFPDLELVEHETSDAVLLLDDQVIAVDVLPTHTEIAISYGVPKDGDWLADRLGRLASAAGAAGHDTLFDAQLGRAVTLPADREEIVAMYGDGVGFATGLQEQASRTERRGLLSRLFGR